MHPPISLLLLTIIPPLMVLALLTIRRLHRSRIAASAAVGAEPTRGTQASTVPGDLQGKQPLNAATFEKKFIDLANSMRTLSELTAHLHEQRRTFERNSRPPSPASENVEATVNRHYLSFTLDNAEFAIDMQHVSGVLEASQLIADPTMPSKIRRAIKLEGSLVPVIDLGARLGGQSIEIGRSTRIILLERPRDGIPQTIGVLIDAAGKVLEIDPGDIEPPPSFGTDIHGEFIHGLGRPDNSVVILLDIERVLSAGGLALAAGSSLATQQEHWPI